MWLKSKQKLIDKLIEIAKIYWDLIYWKCLWLLSNNSKEIFLIIHRFFKIFGMHTAAPKSGFIYIHLKPSTSCKEKNNILYPNIWNSGIFWDLNCRYSVQKSNSITAPGWHDTDNNTFLRVGAIRWHVFS